MTSDLLDPREMTTEERDAEIVALLAAAALRRRFACRATASHLAPRGLVTPPLSKSRNRLDVANGESPHVPS